MKKIYIYLFISTLYTSSFAQIKDTTYWSRNLETGINLNQSSFSSNWVGGGVNNIAAAVFFYFNSEYIKTRSSVKSSLLMDYGKINPQNEGWRKNLDRIFFDNIYEYAVKKTWGAFGSATFQTQFDKGFNSTRQYVISSFLSPGYLNESFGLVYTPAKYFQARFGLVAFRQTFCINKNVDEVQRDTLKKNNSYGVPFNETLINELGTSALVKFDKDIAKNMNLKLMYQYFSSYDNMAKSTDRLDLILTAKVNRFVNVNIQGVVLYNQDQSLSVQSSQALAMGVVYRVKNAKDK